MNDSQESQTNVSFLLRIKDNADDPTAWREFVQRYGARIYDWCVNRRLQSADAEDVTQNVLVKLARNLNSFEYEQKLTFRDWLRRVTENAVTDFFRKCKSRRLNQAIEDAR